MHCNALCSVVNWNQTFATAFFLSVVQHRNELTALQITACGILVGYKLGMLVVVCASVRGQSVLLVSEVDAQVAPDSLVWDKILPPCLLLLVLLLLVYLSSDKARELLELVQPVWLHILSKCALALSLKDIGQQSFTFVECLVNDGNDDGLCWVVLSAWMSEWNILVADTDIDTKESKY